MSAFHAGLVHCPVTPFRRDLGVDYGSYAKLIEFHLRNGADALALPMPEGEDLSLTDAEQREVIAFAVKQVKARVPVIAHASDAGTMIAVERAKFAEKAGASAIVTHPPYFWHPRPAMVVEHVAAVGSATKLPVFVCTPPVENVGTHLTADMFMQIVDRVPNLRGVVDAGMDFVFMEEIMSNRRARKADYDLVSGADYMVSPAACGGRGAFSSLAAIAPKLVREVHERCASEDYIGARKGQEELAALRQLVKQPRLETGLKAALRALGRDCGEPRPPARPLTETQQGAVAEAISTHPALRSEPRGW
ncbi:MAG: dihydrodipicolinate synthase family protein [Burkholderiales bacterium]|nr:dihydrodipicolinate synthase family protein [Burkholderiales bacterium]